MLRLIPYDNGNKTDFNEALYYTPICTLEKPKHLFHVTSVIMSILKIASEKSLLN